MLNIDTRCDAVAVNFCRNADCSDRYEVKALRPVGARSWVQAAYNTVDAMRAWTFVTDQKVLSLASSEFISGAKITKLPRARLSHIRKGYRKLGPRIQLRGA